MSIDAERLKKWVQLRSKELEGLNDLEKQIETLYSIKMTPEVQQAVKVLKNVLREERLAIQIRMSEVRGKLNMPNAGKQFEPYEK